MEWDIVRATTSIEVYCAFLDPQPVRRWSALLGARVFEGVRVVVHTRSPEEQREAAGAARQQQQIEALRAVGCQVGFRERMREKVLILDSTVLWHGSLNLLASSGPTDLMMRFTDPASCERVSRVIDRARKERSAWNPCTAKGGDAGTGPAASALMGPGTTGTAGIRPGDVVDGRLCLDVSYGEKNEAEALLKAQWDKSNRLWYVVLLG
ncbi:DUF5710 domain-containing protein [Kitasatospora sp. NPDC093806]|uniref:DUF5710 domain-containing protein n=1 Tax=Kitasatospora sp. NPDC093806 TaxID=3155075 RepID=UPI0034388253